MEVISYPPTFHAGFSPVLLTCGGAIGEPINMAISTIAADGRLFSHSISAVLIKSTQTFNLAAYVQSLFEEMNVQSIYYDLKVCDKEPKRFYALRSAVQIGESADLSYMLGRPLTDMDRIDVWEGYPPREVSILAEDGYQAQLATGDASQNIRLLNGLNTVAVDCSSSEITVYTNVAYWSGYHCQVEEVSYFFTVHVGDRTAKLSGTVSLTVDKPEGITYTLDKSYSGFQDVHFEIPVNDTIVGVNLTADGNLDTESVQIIAALQPYREHELPDVTLALPVAYDVLAAAENVSIGHDSSRLLHITINQPITE